MKKMKRLAFTILTAVLSLLQIQASNDVLRIVHGGITDYAPLSAIDSIYFDENGATMFIQPIEKVAPVGIARTDISSLEYIAADACPGKISVVYNGNSITAENPFLLSGVSIVADGAYVTVKNTNIATEYTTDLSGSTTDGSLTYEGNYKATIVLNGVSITSQRGAAIDIECGKRIALELKKGTVNTLTDAAGGKQKAALYCKGHLEIDKTGILNVTGNTAHAISAKEYIQLKKSTGVINILGAKNDGIHCKQYFSAKGFTVNISGIDGDGIQAEVEELDEGETYGEDYENGSIQIMDGTFTITSANDGGVRSSETTETTKSYKVYVAKTVGTNGGWGGNRGGNYWNNIYLYKADGTLVSQLTSTVTLSGTNGQSLQFYVYDFGQNNTGNYYFKSDDYSGNGGTSYTIVSQQFTGPQSGIDYYYQISNSYTTSGTTRTFPLTSVQDIYGGSSGESADTYNSVCLKADKAVDISGGTFVLTNSGSMSKSIKAGNSDYEGTVAISGGDITCNVSGDMYLSGTDATYCAAVKTDNYYGTGGTITINASTGKAIRGISADNVINISDGTYSITNSSNGNLGSNDTYTAKGLTCDKDIILTGGNFTIKATGTGGKCIKADGEIIIGTDNGTGPVITASTSGTGLGTSSGGGPGGCRLCPIRDRWRGCRGRGWRRGCSSLRPAGAARGCRIGWRCWRGCRRLRGRAGASGGSGGGPLRAGRGRCRRGRGRRALRGCRAGGRRQKETARGPAADGRPRAAVCLIGCIRQSLADDEFLHLLAADAVGVEACGEVGDDSGAIAGDGLAADELPHGVVDDQGGGLAEVVADGHLLVGGVGIGLDSGGGGGVADAYGLSVAVEAEQDGAGDGAVGNLHIVDAVGVGDFGVGRVVHGEVAVLGIGGEGDGGAGERGDALVAHAEAPDFDAVLLNLGEGDDEVADDGGCLVAEGDGCAVSAVGIDGYDHGVAVLVGIAFIEEADLGLCVEQGKRAEQDGKG